MTFLRAASVSDWSIRNEHLMPIYEHIQPGQLLRLLLGALIVATAAGGIAFIAAAGIFEGAIVMLVTSLVMAVFLLLFHSLTVRVSAEEVAIAFGIGLIRKSFPVEEITQATAVKNRWYYGWGIKLYPGGWLYNVSGFDAVELHFSNGKQCRIGTDEPAKLLKAIVSVRDTQPT